MLYTPNTYYWCVEGKYERINGMVGIYNSRLIATRDVLGASIMDTPLTIINQQLNINHSVLNHQSTMNKPSLAIIKYQPSIAHHL